MKTLCTVALMWTLVSVSFAQQDVSSGAPIAAKGTMVTAANGWRLGSVYRVGPDGSPQIIIDGRLVTIPANTLSVANGKVITSLDKSQVLSLR